MGRIPAGMIRYLLLALVVVIGVAVTLFAVRSSVNGATERAQVAFDQEVSLHVLLVEDRIHRALEGVEEIGGLFDASDTVTRAELSAFVERAIERHPDVRSLAWAPLVAAGERDAFEAESRASGAIGSGITDFAPEGVPVDAGVREAYFPVFYAVAPDGTPVAGGVDITTWPWASGIWEQARDAADMRVTPAFASPSGSLVMVIQPVFQEGLPTANADDRRASIEGFVVGVLEPGKLLGNAGVELFEHREEHTIAIRATDASTSRSGGALIEEPGFDGIDAEFTKSTNIHVENQVWDLTLASTSTFFTSRDANQPWVLLALGLSITVLVSGYLVILQRRSTTAEAMVAIRARQLSEANAALSREVKDRTLGEALVIAERAQLQSILDTTVDGMITIDGAGVIQSFNRAAQELFGYAPLEVLGKNVKLLMPEPDHSAHDEYLNNYARTGEAKIMGIGREVEGRRKDGSSFPLELSVSQVPVADGTLYTGIVRDITRRRFAEEELRASEERFRALLDSAPVGIEVSSEVESATLVNPALAQMLGVDASELLGKRLTDFWYPGHTQEAGGSRAPLLNGEVDLLRYQRLLQRADGAPLWVNVTARAVDVPDGPRLIMRLVQDITESKQTEEALRESKERFQTLFDSSPVGMMVSPVEGGIAQANPVFSNLLGVETESLMGEDLSKYWFPGHEQQDVGSTQMLAAGDIKQINYERLLQKADGTAVWVSVTGTMLDDPAGKPMILRTFEDITERRAAEQQLRKSEERFRLLFDLAPIGLSLKDRNNKIISANPAAQAIIGRTSDELMGAEFKDFLAHGVTRRAANVSQQMITGKTNADLFERPYDRPDGTVVWVKGVSTAVRDADGEFQYAIQAMEDITERRLAEQGLRDSEQRFRSLFDSSPIGIAMVGPDHTLQAANSSLAKMLSTTVEELKGTLFGQAFPPSPSGEPDSYWDDIARGGIDDWQSERAVSASGVSAEWVNITSSAVRGDDGQFLYSIHMIEDISAIKRAQTEIRASEYRFRSLFDSSPIGIALIDANAHVTSVNAALQQMLGIEIEDIIGLELNIFRLPDNTPVHARRGIYMSENPEIGGFDTERLFRRKDGSELWAQVVTAPVRDDDGNFLFGVRMLVDITERKQVERLKDEFLSMVSHELRTPLTAIQAGVGLAASGALGPLPEKATRMLKIADDNSHRLMRLVNDVLDIERMTAGRIVLERVESSIALLVEQAVQAVSAIADESDVHVETAPSTGVVTVDPDRIVQTLTNLVANAVKFSPQGSTVRVDITEQPDRVKFNIIDQGRGIPREQLPRIFDRFYQVDASDSRVYSGTGLGLAISKWIIDEHGGTIWAESTVGAGSTFSFELPRYQ
jgi:PAS domain S-box-containing protein